MPLKVFKKQQLHKIYYILYYKNNTFNYMRNNNLLTFYKFFENFKPFTISFRIVIYPPIHSLKFF